MRKTLLSLFLIGIGACPLTALRAQQVALKTNLLWDATLTPNLGLEVGLGRQVTAQLFYGLNPWQSGHDKRFRHWQLLPEVRLWICQRFNGHFFGLHAMGGEFNTNRVDWPLGILPDGGTSRYEGWNVGGGLTYGYQWIVSRHLNIEASLGVGYNYLRYRRYGCERCDGILSDSHKHYFGPTKAVLSLTYLF